MNASILNNLVELIARKGIRDVVLCPGSRSAPLTLAFVRNKSFVCRTFSDERSAAFIAMGIAQQMRTPVVLVCTSGSAAYNFAPAIAEAYFQQIPLLVLTADRPNEWIDQFDGQTIRQRELYGRHVKRFYELPGDYDHADAVWFGNRTVNEAINLASADPQGPVHVNAPFREPLYESTGNSDTNQSIRVIDALQGVQTLAGHQWSDLQQRLLSFKKILVVAGQSDRDPALLAVLKLHHSQCAWPVVGDILSNLHELPFFCNHSDTFLGYLPEVEKQRLQPDLLITFGKSLVAKNLKLFLRAYRPKEHWHLQTSGEPADTFQGLTKVIPVTPSEFFSQMNGPDPSKGSNPFAQAWAQHEQNALKGVDRFFSTQIEGEFSLVKRAIESLPPNSNLHLSNSMAVRYANHIGLREHQNTISVFVNRGTSGIDGCTSTAVGSALASPAPTVLITGDLAFFYDRNAFWHNYPLPNLFIVVLNNHGGIIFNLIDGPSRQPEADEFFITRQPLNAKALAREFGFSYADPTTNLAEFFQRNGGVRIMEIDSTQALNKKIFEEFKINIKKQYGA